MIVRMRFRKWDGAFECKQLPHLPISVSRGKSCGFLECFETVDDLRAEYPDEHEYVEVAERP